MDQFTGQAKSLNEVILELPKGQRPDPASYMTQAQIDEHLALFEDGVTKIKGSAPTGTEGPPGGTFVMPKAEADRIIRESGGDVHRLEDLLGLEHGTLGAGPVRVDIANPSGLRVPSGNELGANSQWIPGGRTSGGIPEAAISPVPPGQYQVVPIYD
ncbi:hypothetical protein [Pelagibacterium halotolerans]|uniref:hypothetical protein n=1 Tax=Pelagibacterium halotolerans TaxID=531813 RepID=UPI00384AB7B3